MEMLQLGQMLNLEKHEALSTTRHLQDMKQQVLNMMQVPDDAKPFLTQVVNLLKDNVLPELQKSKDADKTQHDTQYDTFTTLAQDYASATSALDPLEGERDQKQQQHATCRNEESTLHGNKVVCTGEEASALQAYETARGNLGSAEVGMGMHNDRSCVAGSTTDVWLSSTDNIWDSYRSSHAIARQARADYKAKGLECTGRASDLAAKKQACEQNQTAYENAACTYATRYRAANSAYTLQYDMHKTDFEADSQAWSTASEDRVKQCEVVHLIVCYVEGLNNTESRDDVQAAIDQCDQTAADNADCTSYSFIPNPPLPPTPVPPLPLVCDDANFPYISPAMPAGTSLAPCTSCSGLHGTTVAPTVAPTVPPTTTPAPTPPATSCALDLSSLASNGAVSKTGPGSLYDASTLNGIIDGFCPSQATSWTTAHGPYWSFHSDLHIEINLGGVFCIDGAALLGDYPDTYHVKLDGNEVWQATQASGGGVWWEPAVSQASLAADTCSTTFADFPESCGSVVSVSGSGGDSHYAVKELRLRGKLNPSVPGITCSAA